VLCYIAAVDAAIRAVGLTKRFGARTAFEDLTFDVGAGEVFGFLGPNGAGKTTTVRVLATIVRPTSGTAEVAGIPVTEESGAELRAQIAVMPETPGLYLRLTVYDNLEYFAGLYGISRRDAHARIMAALEAVGLAERSSDFTGGLSKGLRQRVSLARTLLSDPRVLFLDEPTSGLDPVATREVRELIEGLRGRGVTVFLTTHRLEEAERLCDRIAILNTTLRILGRPEDLRRELFSSALEVATVGPIEDLDSVLQGLPNVTGWKTTGDYTYAITTPDPDALAPALARTLVQGGASLLKLAEVQHSLEDVYLQLVNEDVEVTR
jgi:ABC-2 type transport system ATP-binding protein